MTVIIKIIATIIGAIICSAYIAAWFVGGRMLIDYIENNWIHWFWDNHFLYQLHGQAEIFCGLFFVLFAIIFHIGLGVMFFEDQEDEEGL